MARMFGFFDIDETTLSNLPYYASDAVAFGAMAYNATSFNAWVEEAAAPAIPGSLKLYRQLIELGFNIVFLTGTEEAYAEAREFRMEVEWCTNQPKEKHWKRMDIGLEAIWVINGAIYLETTPVIESLKCPIQCTTSVNAVK
ncbi:acid phosphatase, class B-like protein [Tanacetum coccineum]